MLDSVILEQVVPQSKSEKDRPVSLSTQWAVPSLSLVNVN